MSELIAFSAPDGASVLVELDESTLGFRASGRMADAVGRAGESIANARDLIGITAAALREGLAETLPDEPDELEIGFGVKLGGEAGAFVAKSTIEAHISVRMVWKKS